MKKPFVTKAQLEQLCQSFPTPFHLYDEKGIRENKYAYLSTRPLPGTPASGSFSP